MVIFYNEPRNQIMDSESFKFKTKMTGSKAYNVSSIVEIIVPLKDLINIWKTLYLPLADCEVSSMLSLPDNCFKDDIATQAKVPAESDNASIPTIN